jgi:hypothetical protein
MPLSRQFDVLYSDIKCAKIVAECPDVVCHVVVFGFEQ